MRSPIGSRSGVRTDGACLAVGPRARGARWPVRWRGRGTAGATWWTGPTWLHGVCELAVAYGIDSLRAPLLAWRAARAHAALAGTRPAVDGGRCGRGRTPRAAAARHAHARAAAGAAGGAGARAGRGAGGGGGRTPEPPTGAASRRAEPPPARRPKRNSPTNHRSRPNRLRRGRRRRRDAGRHPARRGGDRRCRPACSSSCWRVSAAQRGVQGRVGEETVSLLRGRPRGCAPWRAARRRAAAPARDAARRGAVAAGARAHRPHAARGHAQGRLPRAALR